MDGMRYHIYSRVLITVVLFGEEILNEIYTELACCRKRLPALYLGLQ